jgi:hypothetical protein
MVFFFFIFIPFWFQLLLTFAALNIKKKKRRVAHEDEKKEEIGAAAAGTLYSAGPMASFSFLVIQVDAPQQLVSSFDRCFVFVIRLFTMEYFPPNSKVSA